MTILVCEDDPNNRQGFSALLSIMGYSVLAADTGKKAIAICKNKARPIDLLISDVDLPDVSGTEVALKVAESNPHLPILFVSATPLDEWNRRDLYNLKQLPAALVDFLEKPFRLSSMRDKIGKLLRHFSGIVQQQDLSELQMGLA
jgi:CheY-like chemotaxis protein